MSFLAPFPSAVSLLNGVFHGLQFIVIGLLIWSTVAGRDLWPFSHYPMFGGYREPASERFFRLQFHFPDGRVVSLPDHAANVGEAFNRDFHALWPQATDSAKTAWNEVSRRGWEEACGLAPALASARKVEVILRLAQVGRAGGIAVSERMIHSVELIAFTG